MSNDKSNRNAFISFGDKTWRQMDVPVEKTRLFYKRYASCERTFENICCKYLKKEANVLRIKFDTY